MAIPFTPAIRISGEKQIYQDGSVSAEMESFGPNLIIHTLSSSETGKGNTSRAIEWLRAEGFKSITVKGFGHQGRSEDGPNSALQAYWVHMQAKGLVDMLVTDDNAYIGKQEHELFPDEEDDLDEFTLHRMLVGATNRLDKIAVAISVSPEESAKESGERKLKSFAVLRAFSVGALDSQDFPLEDSDELYDMLDAAPDRYAAIMSGIFYLAGKNSETAALIMLRHSKNMGLVTFDMGSESPLTFLHNPSTGQVLSSNGVMSLADVRMGRAVVTVPPKDARALAQSADNDPDVLKHFSWVAELIFEQHGLSLKADEPQASPSP